MALLPTFEEAWMERLGAWAASDGVARVGLERVEEKAFELWMSEGGALVGWGRVERAEDGSWEARALHGSWGEALGHSELGAREQAARLSSMANARAMDLDLLWSLEQAEVGAALGEPGLGGRMREWDQARADAMLGSVQPRQARGMAPGPR